MSAAIVSTKVDISEREVRESIAVARSHGEKFFEQIVWQVENEAWRILGYASWDEMRLGEYDDMGVVAPRADRPELVARMRAKGLTQAQIAGTLGVDRKTVMADLSKSETDIEDSPPVITNARGQERPAAYKRTETIKVEDTIVADPATGEVVEAPAITPPTPKPPKPVPSGDAAELLNAETVSKDIGRALMSLSGMQYPEHRDRVIAKWWPLGNEAVPPDWRALFEPSAIREIAGWLLELATDLEGIEQ